MKKKKPTPKFEVNEPDTAYAAAAKSESYFYIAHKKNEALLKRTAQFLHIEKDLSFANISNNQDLILRIRKGLKKISLDEMMQITGFSLTEMAHFLNTTDRTLRRYDASQMLNTEQTERLIEMARLYARGEEVFGDLESFRHWMSTDVIALGRQKPSSFLDTSMGIDMLMNELGLIEHGIFA